MTKGKIFILSGPSGVGKSTILKKVLEKRDNLYFSVSATTRPPREGERDGVDYHFLDQLTFDSWVEQGLFFEHATFADNSYGTPTRYIDEALAAGKDAVLDIEVQGAMQVIEKRPDAVRIFIAPPSWPELERRLVERKTDPEEKIRKRLARAKEEFRFADDYDYMIVNQVVEQAAAELDAILLAEHCRPAESKTRIIL